MILSTLIATGITIDNEYLAQAWKSQFVDIFFSKFTRLSPDYHISSKNGNADIWVKWMNDVGNWKCVATGLTLFFVWFILIHFQLYRVICYIYHNTCLKSADECLLKITEDKKTQKAEWVGWFPFGWVLCYVFNLQIQLDRI